MEAIAIAAFNAMAQNPVKTLQEAEAALAFLGDLVALVKKHKVAVVVETSPAPAPPAQV